MEGEQMSVYPNQHSSSSSPLDPADANSQSYLSRHTSVISTSSSSSSLLTAPPPIRNHVASGSSSTFGSPSRTGRPPPWLSRHFEKEPTNSSEDRISARTPNPSPVPPAIDRPRMTSPDDFEFGEELGGGSWSTVVEAIYPPTSKKFAIKILNKAQLVKEKMTRYAVVEKNALALLGSGDHPGIVRLYSAFHDSTSLYLVLSLAPNGDLKELVKKQGSLSLPCARYYIAQLIDTVQWIHSKGVLHRDLKPENILLDSEMRIKLTDFGSAYISNDFDLSPRQSTFVGTAAYVSPELLLGSVKTTSRSSDIWAIGCILYHLMLGQSPFLALNDYLSFKKIEALNYTFPEGFDPDAKDLIQHILVLDPSERLGVPPRSSPSELREHVFFSSQNLSTPENHPMSYINWNTLWTDPPVSIESGLVQAPPPELHIEHTNQLSWGGFINEFSLTIDDQFPEVRPLELEGQEGPHELPEDSRSTSPPDHEVNGQSPKSSPSISASPLRKATSIASIPQSSPTENDTCVTDREIDPAHPTKDLKLLAKIDSCSILIPPETVRLAAQVETRSRHRIIQTTQRRVLVLTTLPRVLCMKEKSGSPSDSAKGANALVVKQEFTFSRGIADTAAVTHPLTNIVDVEHRRERDVALKTPEKCYIYTTRNQMEASLWVEQIRALLALRLPIFS